MATANAEAESKCSSSISWWWGTWLLLVFWWLFDAFIDPGIPWFGTDIAADDCSLLFLFPFILHECWAVADDPVEVSDMEDPEDENGGSDLSDGEGEGALRCIWPMNQIKYYW